MAIEESAGGTIVTGKEDIDFFRLLTLRSALKLEIVGLKRRGRSVYSIVKEELGFKGSKDSVFKQLDEYINELKQQREKGE